MLNKVVKILLAVTCILNIFISFDYAIAKDIPFTLEDRDRLIKIETTLKEFKESVDKRFESVDKRFESIDKRFNELINIFIGMVAAFAGIVAVTIGFAIWDRRTTLSPIKNENSRIREREEMLERVLKEYAKDNTKMRTILQKVGLL
ncbi:MAG: hypothetical protein SVZ03_02125 [Spirochaetota bacterium]|nr:hypothetical protein [Spirochaetota bacterium]